MLSTLHTPTNGVPSIGPQHWGGKPAVSADSCKNGCNRFHLPDISEDGCPPCSLLSTLVCARWLHWLNLSLCFGSQRELMRGTGVQNDVLKPMMGNHVSNLRFSKIGYQIKTQPTQLFTREECVYFNFVFFQLHWWNLFPWYDNSYLKLVMLQGRSIFRHMSSTQEHRGLLPEQLVLKLWNKKSSFNLQS